MSLFEGQVLDGKYVIRRRIADGGMSTVYLGVNRRIGKDVAVKVLHSAVARDAELVNRFEREACIVSRIRSANVADVYDFGELPSGERFMVMEYLDGESLATKLDREGTLSPLALARIADQILLALAAAHDAGVVHRDLKPENVLLTVSSRSGELTAKVVDFGISKVLSRSPWVELTPGRGADVLSTEMDLRLTSFDSVLGTPLYMAPEQVQSGVIDERTDIYSLGVILYEATSGEMPLVADNVNDLLLRVVCDEPVPLLARMPSVDPVWSAIVEKALAKSPCDRFQSADEMREAIRGWAALGPMRPRPDDSVLTPWPLGSLRVEQDDDPPLDLISIDGIGGGARRFPVKPSIVVEVGDERVGEGRSRLHESRSPVTLRRWPLVAGFGLVLCGALAAQHLLLVSAHGPVRGGDVGVRPLHAAPAEAPAPMQRSAPKPASGCPTPAAEPPPSREPLDALDMRSSPSIVTALDAPPPELAEGAGGHGFASTPATMAR